VFFLNTPCFEILLLPLLWRRVMLYSFFSMLYDHITFFSYASWAYTFFQWHLSPFARIQEEKSLWTLEHLFLVVDGMFCVTFGVGVSIYMWVYVISMMEARKDSTKGHNNLSKLNGSQASMCRRFMHWYRHMALVGNMTIDELSLFYSQKEIIQDFTLLWDREDQHFRTISC
jgi:hypothetical protein